MNNDDEEALRFGADHYLKKMLDRKSVVDQFLAGIKVAIIALSFLMSIYSVYKCTSISGNSGSSKNTLQDISLIKADLLKEEHREEEQQNRITKINSLIATFSQVLSGVTSPQMFDCYRTTRLSRAATVTYDGCHVDTTSGAMNPNTGIFTVKTPGIYSISFTAKYVSSSKGRFGAWSDIFVNDTVIADSQREYNGNEISTSESSTHTVMVYYNLGFGDMVKVQFNKDGASYIHSDQDHDVHFTARRIGEEAKKKPAN